MNGRCPVVKSTVTGDLRATVFGMAEHNAGEAVRRTRESAGVSLRALAGAVGISPATLSALETGKSAMTVDRLAQLAAALDVPVTRMLTQLPAEEQRMHPTDAAATSWRVFEPLTVGPVLSAALRVFVAKGFHAASMRDVAAEAGLSVAGVYHHYASKTQLLVELFDLTMAELRWRVLAAREEGGSEREKFARMVEALALFHAIRGDLAFVGASEMRGLPAAERERITGLRNELQYLLDEQAAASIAAGELGSADPHTATRAVATMCTALPSWFRPDGALTAEQVAAQYADYALRLLS